MDLKMRKPTYSEVYMYKNIYWLAFLLFVFIPLFQAFVISPISVVMSGNIAYKNVFPIVKALSSLLSYLSIYGGFGVLAASVCYFGFNARGVITLALLNNLISYFSLWVVKIFVDPYADEGGEFIVMCVDTIINTLFVLVLLFAVIVYSKKRGAFMNIPNYGLGSLLSKHPFTVTFTLVSVIYFLLKLVIEIITTVIEPSAPGVGSIRTAEIYARLISFGFMLVEALAGLAVMMLIGILMSRLRKRGRMVYAQNPGIKI